MVCLQFSGHIHWDYIWLLRNDTKNRRRRIWRSCSPSPGRAFCFDNSLSVGMDSGIQLGPLLICAVSSIWPPCVSKSC
ncbi:hypothetical protein Goklo_022698 [Gossypium klotzschianum]|uniref:Uncharacterized protein n=1 Tax=Gossypium klotzschianum TaxID=34286 RepID=A0A7J8TNB4_9ROSI|nr:hypothetical protein [Gossypium klotzschianum]